MFDNNTMSYGGYRYFELKEKKEEIKDILRQIKENDFTEEEIEYIKNKLEEYEIDSL